jgi:UDPglucose 6-dehydrogenase
MRIGIFGTGYVGLVTGLCFAEVGNEVICFDNDVEKLKKLKKGISPIYEESLDDFLKQNHKSKRIKFTSKENEIFSCDVLIVAVGTPQSNNGAADLSMVFEVASSVGKNITRDTLLLVKSTVPVGTCEKIEDIVQKALKKRKVKFNCDVVSNPEFLTQGRAIRNFMSPDRIIVGCDHERPMDLIKELYSPFAINRDKLLFMSRRDSEMTKYVANAFLATKVSFMNEIANLSEILGVDVENVRKGIGADSRIGYAYIYPGCGYGGSCLPKDVAALIYTAKTNDYEPLLLEAVSNRNGLQKKVIFQKIKKRFKSLKNKTFAIWGVSFKPGTDDLREAPSVELIKSLMAAGASVRVHDPAALENAKKIFGRTQLIKYFENQYDSLKGADALVLLTEWKPFRLPNFSLIKKALKSPVIFDGRNQYDPRRLHKAGFEYFGIGR